MKLIEALKKKQELAKKADDIKDKIRDNSAYLSFETPPYDNPKKKVSEWLQAHSDILKEILHLRVAIQRTNLETDVTIELAGKNVTKNIAEWIHRRRDLATAEMQAWQMLTDRNLREGEINQSTGEKIDVTIVRNFDAEKRDTMVSRYSEEPSLIDAKLEITNAVTDLIE